MPMQSTAVTILLCMVAMCYSSQHNSRKMVHGKSERIGKFLSPFQIVTFPNDACEAGSKNGTCYSEAECSSLGGTNDGSCADGFGVCCTFTINCGGSSSQNCTYFDSEDVVPGGCKAQICPSKSDICQLRLDFVSFTITGPSILTDSVVMTSLGLPATLSAKAQSAQTQCLTDSFSVTNPNGAAPPTICGVNNDQHMYVDSSTSCNDLVFQLGNTAVGNNIPTRGWSIKVTQYSCDYPNLAPQGCTQYFFGPASDSVQSFNYNNGMGQQLANQRQTICIRREAGNCRICFFTAMPSDFNVSGSSGTKNAGTMMTGCCGYTGPDVEDKKGFDCVQIPNAEKKVTANTPLTYSEFCGNQGFITASAPPGEGQPVCSSVTPFRINYLTNSYEAVNDPASEGAFETDTGFSLQYTMDAINC